MVWYDVDLDTDDLLKLNDEFSKGHFSIADRGRGYYLANYVKEGKEISIMAYNEKMMTIFHGAVKELPEEVQTDIRKKLCQLTALEKIAQNV